MQNTPFVEAIRLSKGATPHPSFVLPDLLQAGLNLVFCGTAAGPMSAARGHYYAHPQNKFWKALYESGLTPYQLAPCDFPRLLEWKIGLTDIGKYVFGLDNDLPTQSLGRESCEQLVYKIKKHKPRILAFTSLQAGKKFLRRRSIEVGMQDEQIGPTKIWVLPSPSPLAIRKWALAPWQDLATHIRQEIQ